MDDELLFRSATGRATPEEEDAVAVWATRSEGNRRRLADTVEILRLAALADDSLALESAPKADDLLSPGGRRRHPAGLRRRGARAWPRVLLPVAVAASVLVAFPVVRWYRGDGRDAGTAAGLVFGSDEFLTEAEPATVGLRDGSVVRLAPESRLRVIARKDGRDVSLAGRGYFAVASDPDQPFTVHSDAGTVTALGTRFDVTAVGEDLRVIVIEGSVRLAARGSQVVVRAGQLAQVVKGNLVPPVDVPDPAALVGWVGNFIAFHDTPLRTVVGEIEQRYDVKVELSDGALGDRTVTALFAGRSYEEIVEVICVVTHLRCTSEGRVLTMSPAR